MQSEAMHGDLADGGIQPLWASASSTQVMRWHAIRGGAACKHKRKAWPTCVILLVVSCRSETAELRAEG